MQVLNLQWLTGKILLNLTGNCLLTCLFLHYGLNIVRNVRTDYSYYRKGLVRQLSLLKEISPSTPVLVVGVTDMAYINGDSIVSYSNIPSIIEAQKIASDEAGVTILGFL